MLENLTTTVNLMQTYITDLNQGQVKIEQRLDKLEQGQIKLEQSFAKLEKGQSDLLTYVRGIHHHQNEDFALLQSVDRKVDGLAATVGDHEEKFRKIKAL
ncbi:MAG: hypothetical protein FWC76_07035 [Defluviitaleaceae bacterium]|nr:hypothetical protein [Defluviitaleaceae bacterium]